MTEKSSTKSKVAIAVFVKTPPHSGVKTRLANSIGVAKAEEFYFSSVAAVEMTIRDWMNQNMSGAFSAAPYWVVAEEKGMNDVHWKTFPNLFQGCGSLGDRLDAVYEHLIERHNRVILLGADCPQISSTEIQAAVQALATHSFVIGPAEDGGFYLFGGRRRIPKEVWTKTEYSTSRTSKMLSDQLTGIGSIATLGALRDVDEESDLTPVRESLASLKFPNSAQLCLLASLEKYRAG